VLRDDGMSCGDYVEQLTYPIKGVSDQSKGAATIIVCGRKNMSVTLWFTVLKLIYEADYSTPLSGTKIRIQRKVARVRLGVVCGL